MITAPFNFVPLNEKVFFPPWADDVSHDVPFEDGESGCIDITITAKSPIFIRDSVNEEQFCNHNGVPYIPGSSVKGMVRNVLEIMSFSKMSFIDDTTYSVRDLKYTKYMDKSKNVQCGWLFYDENGKLKIEDCGEPYRIKYDEIERKFGGNFKKSNFMDGTFQNANSPYKKAYEKYNLIDEDIFQNIYSFSNHKEDGPGRKIVTFEENGPNQGKLVLTGHPSARIEPENGKKSGKIYDFVFKQKENSNDLDVSKEVFDNFKFAYFDGRTTQPTESPDWNFWKQRLNDGGRVPVFFHKNFSGVSSFGLSYLYKFPYEKSIMKALIGNHGSDEIDLAESIFGFSRKADDEQVSLKGRVQFSHAKKICNTNSLNSRYVLLGSPKASYYPIYLVQNGGEYKTLMDSNSVLAGWKRYPIHQNFNHRCQKKSTQTTNITPLNQNSQFKLKVRLQNLKKIEIGALLSAITFHKNDQYFHSIGMAKSYGYGKVQLKIDTFDNFNFTKEEYIKAFESAVNSELFDNQLQWHQSEQIKNLFSMAIPQDDKNLEYMELINFEKEKNDNNFLDRYINLDGVNSKNPNSLIEAKNIEDYNKEIALVKEKNDLRLRKKEEQKKQKQEEKAQKILYTQDWNRVKDSDNIQSLQSFIDKYEKTDIADKNDIEKAEVKIANIKEEQKQEKENEAQKEANDKWNSIHLPVNSKYLKSSLKKFIVDYPSSIHIESANSKLFKIEEEETSTTTSSIEELNTVQNSNKFKSFLDTNKDILKDNKELIKTNAIRVYNSLKGKQKKNFFKDIQLGRFLDKDFEDEVKSMV